MSFPQARVSDMHIGVCTLGAPLPILPPCMPTVLVMNLPAARVGDICMGMTPPPPGIPVPTPHPIAMGSFTVLIGNMPAARVTGLCGMGGTIIPPCAVTVLTGG